MKMIRAFGCVFAIANLCKAKSLLSSVPFGWHQAGTTGDADPCKAFAAETTQIFTIDPTGTTSVRKLGNEASREISGHVFLNGERVW